MKIITWNINGIRSLKKTVSCLISELGGDVICFQETKVYRSQLPETIALVDGYMSYFTYPQKQSGYSGVATYSRDSCLPEDAEDGLSGILQARQKCVNLNDEFSSSDLVDLDSEGRAIVTYHLIRFDNKVQKLAIINVYCPRVDPEKPERHIYKMNFLRLLEAKTKLLCEEGCLVVIVGDLNIAHKLIDHCDPCDAEEFDSHDARRWLTNFLSCCIATPNGDVKMVDAFRHFYPDKKDAYTCWNTLTGARQTNYGTRIDYVLLSSSLISNLKTCEINSDIHGSDHCPVTAVLECDSIVPSKKLIPSICTRGWPEFSGRQQKLQNFLCNGAKMSQPEPESKKIKLNHNKPKQKNIMNFFSKQNGKSELVSTKTEVSQLECGIMEAVGATQPFHIDQESCAFKPKSNQANEWKSVLKGPPEAPLCSGHSKRCILRTVKKDGPNYGRQFFTCALPNGLPSNPEARCNFFQWASNAKISKLKS